MRHLLHSLAAISLLALPLVSHAAGITYSGTLTVTDTTTSAVVGTSSISFTDPPTGGPLNPYDAAYNIAGNIHDGDAMDLKVTFTAPGSGSGTIDGTVDFITIVRTTFNYILWDSTSKAITLSNGSTTNVVLATDLFGNPTVGLSSCASGLCGSSDAYIHVRDNDPPAPTPEPSSLALFGTGVLGLARIVRRRLAA